MQNSDTRGRSLVMIATREPRRGSAPLAVHPAESEVRSMESLSAGTFVGSGSFRCQHCGYALTLEGSDILTPCPSCGGQSFLRASLFSTERISQSESQPTEATLVQPAPPDLGERLERARAGIDGPGEYLVYEEGDELRTVSLS